MVNDAVLPGWYKLEGNHKVTMAQEGHPEKVLTDKPINDYFCMTAEEAKRKNKDQIVDTLEEEGLEILEIKVTRLKDSIRVAIPPKKNVRDSVVLTTVEYRPDGKGITTTIEGTLNHADGSGSVMTETTMTWIRADCEISDAGEDDL